MAPSSTEIIRGTINIDTLPQNLKLKSSYVKHIERSKIRLTTSRRQSSAVAAWCENENNELFQMYLRAGMEDSIHNFLKKQGLDILKSKFFIHTNLRNLKRGSVHSPETNLQNDTGAHSTPALPRRPIHPYHVYQKHSNRHYNPIKVWSYLEFWIDEVRLFHSHPICLPKTCRTPCSDQYFV